MNDIITTMDLGSNSFRVLNYDCNSFSSVGEFEKAVGTADGLKSTGNISNDAINRIIDTINKSKEKLAFNPNEVIAVTTQAMRIAKNSTEVLKKIQNFTGVTFKIIDGNTEAKLTLLAMQYALKREKLPSEKFVLLDIGGGSTELIIYNNGEKKIKSFSFGIVTLAQSSDKKSDFLEFEKEILDFIKGMNFNGFNFISTAGTPTTIAAYKHGLNYESYDKNIINGTKLNIDEVNDLQKKLNELSKKEMIEKVGMGREDFIDTGIEIFKLFYKSLQKDTSIVFDDGLREGVAINYCLG